MINCKCGNGMFYLVRKKAKNTTYSHSGLYCTVCGKWVKWINNKDLTHLHITGRINQALTNPSDWEYLDMLILDFYARGNS